MPGYDPKWLPQSARYFPLVGAIVGYIGVGIWWLSSLCLPPAVGIGFMISANLLVTGAFHEDGFADVCDGFGGGSTRNAVLTIMKDSRIGAYGAIGVAVMLGMRWVSLASLSPAAFPIIVVTGQMVSRWCATSLIWRMQYARSDRGAKSKPLAGSLCTAEWLLSGALGALALLPLVGLVAAGASILWRTTLLVALAVAFATTLCAGLFFKNRIGGYTGDCLGAVQQLSELSFIVAALGVLGAR